MALARNALSRPIPGRDQPVGIDPSREERRSDGPASSRRVAAALFLLLAGIYLLTAGGHPYSSDEEGILATTRSLVERRSPVITVTDDNNRVTPVVAGRTGEPVGVSGIGQSLVTVPLYLVGAVVGTTVADSYVDYTERVFVGFANPFITALGAVFVYLIAGFLGARRRWAVALTLVYGLATMAWPHAKTGFSEPLATTLTLGATLFAFRAGASGRVHHFAGSGAFAGAALLARSSAGLFAPLLATYLGWLAWRQGGRRLQPVLTAGWAFALGAAGPVAVLLASNWWRFGSPFDLGYENVRLDYSILEGLYGLFLSPGKSLFLYAPVALVGLWAIVFVPPHRRLQVGLIAMLGVVNALFFARFHHWHGDHTWGPRYLIMSLPFFVLPIAPLLERIRWRRALLVSAGLGAASALLGTVMYFNQYFHIASEALGVKMAPEGPSYWEDMHYDPYWSPLAGHVRALPDVVSNGLARLDGEDPGLQPFPASTNERYGWFFAPAQPDSWIYWLFPAHGPKKLLLLAPGFVAMAVVGGRRLVRCLRT